MNIEPPRAKRDRQMAFAQGFRTVQGNRNGSWRKVMKLKLIVALMVIAFSCVAMAEEEAATQIELKDGSTLFLHADGTGRMVDAHGKPMAMADGVEMETAAGDVILMMNKKVWRRYGPIGKGGRVLEND